MNLSKFLNFERKLPENVPLCFGTYDKKQQDVNAVFCEKICNEEEQSLCRLESLKL